MTRHKVLEVVGSFVLLVCLAGVAVVGAQVATPSGSPAAGTPCPAASPAASPVASPATIASPSASPAAATCTRVIDVTVQAYKFTPNTFNLTVNQPVTFVVHSLDIYHTFTVKQSQSATTNIFSIVVNPGATASYTWTPTKVGTYFLYCIPHEALGMTGTINVHS